MKKQATIRDVAKLAGVSVAAVSYVLNNVNKVAPETRNRILAAMEQLEYRPSHTARCLSNGKSKLIGVSLPITESGDIPGVLLGHNPFFSEFIAGVESVSRAKGYDLLLSGVSSDEQYKDWIKRRELDGLILLGVYHRDIYEEIKQLDIPAVLIDTYETYAADFHRVMVEDRYGSYLAAKHLIELGHREIAFVTGRVSKSFVNLERYKGYQQALQEAGIPLRNDLLFEEHVSMDGGYRTAQKMLQSGCGATAVCVIADIMAIGFMRGLAEGGKRIPDDLSVIGFDNIEIGQFITPGLTTISQDIGLKGKTSAEIILRDLENGTRTNECVTLRPKLLVRGTTAPLKG